MKLRFSMSDVSAFLVGDLIGCTYHNKFRYNALFQHRNKCESIHRVVLLAPGLFKYTQKGTQPLW
jgi:hypothetical protein